MFKAKLTDRATQGRFLRFLVVGGITAGVQFLLLGLLASKLTPSLAFTLAFTGATSVHYFLNRNWALPSQRVDVGQQLGEYLLTVLASYLINIGAFKFCQVVLGLSVMWAALGAVPPAMLATFLLLNFRVFRSSESG